MTSRNPTAAERRAHAARVRRDREWANLLGMCRDCNARPGINPRTGLPFRSCETHREIDRARKAKPNGKR